MPAPAAPAPAAPPAPASKAPEATPAPAPAKSLLSSITAEPPKGASPDAPKDAPKPVALKAPEGLPTEVFDAFSKEVTNLGVAGDAAQKLLDSLVTSHTTSLRARIEQGSQEMAAASKADPEFGGTKWQESVPLISRGMAALGVTDALKGILDQTGLGNHPDVLRVFYRAGRLLSSDKVLASTSPGAAPAAAHPASVLYDTMNKS